MRQAVGETIAFSRSYLHRRGEGDTSVMQIHQFTPVVGLFRTWVIPAGGGTCRLCLIGPVPFGRQPESRSNHRQERFAVKCSSWRGLLVELLPGMGGAGAARPELTYSGGKRSAMNRPQNRGRLRVLYGQRCIPGRHSLESPGRIRLIGRACCAGRPGWRRKRRTPR